jgi:hypothetical protein
VEGSKPKIKFTANPGAELRGVVGVGWPRRFPRNLLCPTIFHHVGPWLNFDKNLADLMAFCSSFALAPTSGPVSKLLLKERNSRPTDKTTKVLERSKRLVLTKPRWFWEEEIALTPVTSSMNLLSSKVQL